ncbi:hypothetical protein PR048_024372 [Dryococelus australis]|uniref:Uncharacterized protein n=1 Tax=Dryococelus australis TaxID=614101 RepID=A0ABQ9GNH7_9NEOP|nr:hypothetical protein PR048_024372 [Dryococelus australis]
MDVAYFEATACCEAGSGVCINAVPSSFCRRRSKYSVSTPCHSALQDDTELQSALIGYHAQWKVPHRLGCRQAGKLPDADWRTAIRNVAGKWCHFDGQCVRLESANSASLATWQPRYVSKRVSEEIRVALDSEVSRADEGEASAGMKGMGKREIPWKTRRPAPSSDTIPTCEKQGATPPGIEPGSSWWEASSLTTTLGQENFAETFQVKTDFKRVYTEVTFAIGSEVIIMHNLDDAEPITNLQGNKQLIPFCQKWSWNSNLGTHVVEHVQCIALRFAEAQNKIQNLQCQLRREFERIEDGGD